MQDFAAPSLVPQVLSIVLGGHGGPQITIWFHGEPSKEQLTMDSEGFSVLYRALDGEENLPELEVLQKMKIWLNKVIAHWDFLQNGPIFLDEVRVQALLEKG